MLRVITGGESHGPALVAIVDGAPSGLQITSDDIDVDLSRRQAGYGRGGRMQIERDRIRILSGIRNGVTLGSPVTLLVENLDYENWKTVMSADTGIDPEIETRPRPGHGDLAGMLKYGTDDARNILERASARETAARVAAGAIARRILGSLGITVRSRVTAVGTVSSPAEESASESVFILAEDSLMRCTDTRVCEMMSNEIDSAKADGDSLGGVFEIAAFGCMPGLGSHTQSDRRLDGLLCSAVMAIPAIKGVEVGSGFVLAARRGSQTHDEIFYEADRGLYRKTNHAGGIEAGMSNGESILIRAYMKPIPSLARPLRTVDLRDMSGVEAFKERADVCAVPAAAVVGEAVVAIVLAGAAQEKFGGDSISEMVRNMEGYLKQIAGLWKRDERA